MNELLDENRAVAMLMPHICPNLKGKTAIFRGEGMVALFDSQDEAFKAARSRFPDGKYLIGAIGKDAVWTLLESSAYQTAQSGGQG